MCLLAPPASTGKLHPNICHATRMCRFLVCSGDRKEKEVAQADPHPRRATPFFLPRSAEDARGTGGSAGQSLLERDGGFGVFLKGFGGTFVMPSWAPEDCHLTSLAFEKRWFSGGGWGWRDILVSRPHCQCLATEHRSRGS